MSFKKQVISFFFLIWSIFVVAQRTETAINLSEKNNRLIFETENDVLFRSDNYYTAGLALSYTNNNLKKTPAQFLLKSKNSENYTFSGFGFQQRIFTPYSIGEPNSIDHDRPYSAYLLLTNFSVLIVPKNHLKLSNEIGIGVMGEAAKGEEVQTFIHSLIGSVTPVGWDNQLENAFLIDYQFRIEKGFFNDWIASHFVPFTAARVGTLTNRVQIGLITKWGNKNNFLKDATLPNKIGKQLVWEWLFEANLQGVFYDATLEGGLFNDDPNAISNNETISRQYQFRMGVNTYYKRFSFRYMVKFNSTDFNNAVIHRYAGLNVGYSF